MPAEQGNRRLDSWKEISAYLKRDVRTAMRWANTRGLPVHRMPGGQRSGVYAFTAEIDEWLKGPPAVDGSGPEAGPLPHEFPIGSSTVAEEVRRRRRYSGILLATLVSLAALALAAVSFLTLHPLERHVRLSQAVLEGSVLRAFGESGRIVWTHDFGEDVQETDAHTHIPDNQRVWLTDVSGDAGREVLVLVTHGASEDPPNLRDELDCFSDQGKLLWRYSPKLDLKFPGREFSGNWIVHNLVLAPDGGKQAAWLAISHSEWWPGAVVKIDGQGNAKLQFVNSGNLYEIAYAEAAGRPYILAGGYNSEYGMGALAVLKADGPPTSSPSAAGSPYRWLNAPAGQPANYLLFPRSEINLAENDQTNSVADIFVSKNYVDVATLESTEGLKRWYRFPLASGFESFTDYFSDDYRRVYEELQKEGRIHRGITRSSDLRLSARIRKWHDGNWQMLKAGSATPRK